MALLRLFIFLTLATILPAVGLGQVEIDERTGSAATEFLRVKPGGVDQKASRSPAGTRRAIIVCGLAGDREYLDSFTESVRQIKDALVQRFGFSETNIRIQFGRSEEAAEPKAFATDGRATREEIAGEAARLTRQMSDEDLAWIFVIGHSYYDGKSAHLNIPDTDITHRQFAKLFEPLDGGQVVFFLCTPVSGFYIKELSRTNRIIITSTEADAETNASIFHSALSEALSEIEPKADFDLDKNGKVSLLDLYLKSNQRLADTYLNNDPPLIATEHPQLDDNGDGRGSELQIDYLTIEQGGRSDAKKRRHFRTFKDGAVAADTPLPFVAPDTE